MKVFELIAEKKVFFFVDPIYPHKTPIFEKVAQNSPKCRHFENSVFTALVSKMLINSLPRMLFREGKSFFITKMTIPRLKVLQTIQYPTVCSTMSRI